MNSIGASSRQSTEVGPNVVDLSGAAQAHAGTLKSSENLICELLKKAGIEIGGSATHDIVVHDPRFYDWVARDGALGLGEAYVHGFWDSPAVDEMITRIHRAKLAQVIRNNWRYMARVLGAKALNLQTRRRSVRLVEHHYDIGNDLYQSMLDKRMVYTCGYWKDANNLDEAQEAKLDLVCRKLGLRSGMRVLDLGCGWGGFAKYAAENYGVEVTGFSISKEQVALGRELCAGLPVDLRLDDYRNARGCYDCVVSIGIIEHVGYKNYRTYMEVVDRCLAPGGVSLIHTIAGHTSDPVPDTWTQKYIFPNSHLPSIAQLARAMEGLFTIEDLHSFGAHYDPTLMAWYRNFTAAWSALKVKYTDEFYRLWTYYILMSAAAFRARYINLFQIVMTRPDTPAPDCRQS
jgi:cyclopropane-fatty-acyl-phospholipid synthase